MQSRLSLKRSLGQIMTSEMAECRNSVRSVSKFIGAVEDNSTFYVFPGLLASVPSTHNGNGNGMAYYPGEQQSGTNTPGERLFSPT